MHNTIHRVLIGAIVTGGTLAAPAVRAQSAPDNAADTQRQRERAVRVLLPARAPAPPALDGRLDETAWTRANVGTGFVQRTPDAGAPATERTEAHIVYDDDAVYVGMRMYDGAPDSVVARLARRDEAVYSDWAYVLIDSYHDRRTAFAFGVNAAGVERDYLLSSDRNVDEGWDAVWDVAVTVDDEGWTAEFRIPLSQLRFERGSDVWGINFVRSVARRDERSYWSPTPPDAAGVVSSFGELRGLGGIEPARRLEVVPYTVGRLTRAPGEPGDPFYDPNALDGAFGADLKYGLSSNLTLSATVNPDFGQVEADPSEVNLTAFESFFREKRPFFTEGVDIFDAQGPNLFYSRRIGGPPSAGAPTDAVHADVPEASTIIGAAKLTGKTAGGWSIGLLNAVTAEEEARYVDAGGARNAAPVEPLTSYSVARVKRDFRDGESSVGAMLTATNRSLDDDSRLGFLHSAAYTGLVDARHRFAGDTYQIDASVQGSYVEGRPEAIARTQRSSRHYFRRPDAEHLSYDPTRTSLAGYAAQANVRKVAGGSWRWATGAAATSPGFEVNDLGFGNTADVVRHYARVEYDHFRPGRLLRNWNLSSFAFNRWGFDGVRRASVLDVTGNATFQNLWGVYGWIQREIGGVSPDALRGGPAIVSPDEWHGYLRVNSDRRRAIHGSASVFATREPETGSSMHRIGGSLRVRPSGRVELSLGPQFTDRTNAWQYVSTRAVGGDDRYVFARLEQTTASLTTRVSYTFTPDLSLQLYAQPFISAGDYSRFMEVADPSASRFEDRFRIFDAERIRRVPDAGRYELDLDADGSSDLDFGDPDFNVREVRSNVVLRWQWRPGSELFLVWSRGAAAYGGDGRFDLRRDGRQLFEAAGDNTFIIKMSYWLGL